jgi:hypothetical protein
MSTRAPVLPPERDPQVPSCGYFTGETTPHGCQKLMRKYRAAVKVATAASLLAAHVKRSLDVGPLSKSPSKEAHYWRQLREMLDAFNKEVGDA